MGQYLISFVAYTFAMIGVIALSVVVYKKCFAKDIETRKAQYLSVENRLSLSARKSLYVIKAGDEKFLIAGDVDKTTFLAKLNGNAEDQAQEQNTVKFELPKKKAVLAGVSVSEDLRNTHMGHSNVTKMPVMKELARKLSAQRG